jgi:hypothetical protein
MRLKTESSTKIEYRNSKDVENEISAINGDTGISIKG